jgi:hypothetical protein
MGPIQADELAKEMLKFAANIGLAGGEVKNSFDQAG